MKLMSAAKKITALVIAITLIFSPAQFSFAQETIDPTMSAMTQTTNPFAPENTANTTNEESHPVDAGPLSAPETSVVPVTNYVEIGDLSTTISSSNPLMATVRFQTLRSTNPRLAVILTDESGNRVSETPVSNYCPNNSSCSVGVDISGLKGGQYKVEIISNEHYSYVEVSGITSTTLDLSQTSAATRVPISSDEKNLADTLLRSESTFYKSVVVSVRNCGESDENCASGNLKTTTYFDASGNEVGKMEELTPFKGDKNKATTFVYPKGGESFEVMGSIYENSFLIKTKENVVFLVEKNAEDGFYKMATVAPFNETEHSTLAVNFLKEIPSFSYSEFSGGGIICTKSLPQSCSGSEITDLRYYSSTGDYLGQVSHIVQALGRGPEHTASRTIVYGPEGKDMIAELDGLGQVIYPKTISRGQTVPEDLAQEATRILGETPTGMLVETTATPCALIEGAKCETSTTYQFLNKLGKTIGTLTRTETSTVAQPDRASSDNFSVIETWEKLNPDNTYQQLQTEYVEYGEDDIFYQLFDAENRLIVEDTEWTDRGARETFEYFYNNESDPQNYSEVIYSVTTTEEPIELLEQWDYHYSKDQDGNFIEIVSGFDASEDLTVYSASATRTSRDGNLAEHYSVESTTRDFTLEIDAATTRHDIIQIANTKRVYETLPDSTEVMRVYFNVDGQGFSEVPAYIQRQEQSFLIVGAEDRDGQPGDDVLMSDKTQIVSAAGENYEAAWWLPAFEMQEDGSYAYFPAAIKFYNEESGETVFAEYPGTVTLNDKTFEVAASPQEEVALNEIQKIEPPEVSLPDAVKVYQTTFGDGFRVSITSENSGFSIRVTDSKEWYLEPTSGLQSMSFSVNEDGQIVAGSKVQITYYGKEGEIQVLDYALLLAAMNTCPQGEVCELNDRAPTDAETLAKLTKISVTSLDEKGAIYFTKDGSAYKAYRDASGVIIVEKQIAALDQIAHLNLSAETLSKIREILDTAGPDARFFINKINDSVTEYMLSLGDHSLIVRSVTITRRDSIDGMLTQYTRATAELRYSYSLADFKQLDSQITDPNQLQLFHQLVGQFRDGMEAYQSRSLDTGVLSYVVKINAIKSAVATIDKNANLIVFETVDVGQAIQAVDHVAVAGIIFGQTPAWQIKYETRSSCDTEGHCTQVEPQDDITYFDASYNVIGGLRVLNPNTTHEERTWLDANADEIQFQIEITDGGSAQNILGQTPHYQITRSVRPEPPQKIISTDTVFYFDDHYQLIGWLHVVGGLTRAWFDANRNIILKQARVSDKDPSDEAATVGGILGQNPVWKSEKINSEGFVITTYYDKNSTSIGTKTIIQSDAQNTITTWRGTEGNTKRIETVTQYPDYTITNIQDELGRRIKNIVMMKNGSRQTVDYFYEDASKLTFSTRSHLQHWKQDGVLDSDYTTYSHQENSSRQISATVGFYFHSNVKVYFFNWQIFETSSDGKNTITSFTGHSLETDFAEQINAKSSAEDASRLGEMKSVMTPANDSYTYHNFYKDESGNWPTHPTLVTYGSDATYLVIGEIDSVPGEGDDINVSNGLSVQPIGDKTFTAWFQSPGFYYTGLHKTGIHIQSADGNNVFVEFPKDNRFVIDGILYEMSVTKDGVITLTESMPPAVSAYVDELQEQIGDGLKVTAERQENGTYLVRVTDAKDYEMPPISGLKEMTFIISEDGKWQWKSLSLLNPVPTERLPGNRATYYGANSTEITVEGDEVRLLFEAMDTCPQGEVCPASLIKVSDIEIFHRMTSIVVTKVESGAIYFTKNGANYKTYWKTTEDGSRYVVSEKITQAIKIDLPRSFEEVQSEMIAQAHAAIDENQAAVLALEEKLRQTLEAAKWAEPIQNFENQMAEALARLQKMISKMQEVAKIDLTRVKDPAAFLEHVTAMKNYLNNLVQGDMETYKTYIKGSFTYLIQAEIRQRNSYAALLMNHITHLKSAQSLEDLQSPESTLPIFRAEVGFPAPPFNPLNHIDQMVNIAEAMLAEALKLPKTAVALVDSDHDLTLQGLKLDPAIGSLYKTSLFTAINCVTAPCPDNETLETLYTESGHFVGTQLISGAKTTFKNALGAVTQELEEVTNENELELVRALADKSALEYGSSFERVWKTLQSNVPTYMATYASDQVDENRRKRMRLVFLTV